jgi:putative sigma-54 modulation protein
VLSINQQRLERFMKLLVRGRNVAVPEAVQAYAEKRLGKLSRQLDDDDITRVELELFEARNPRVSDSHVAEATVWTKGPTLRAREASHDIYASIDLVAEKLARRVQKYREKRIQYKHGGPHGSADRWKGVLQDNGDGVGMLPPGYEFTTTFEEEIMAQAEPVSIVKTKQFRLGPMSPEEAALQMDLVGHDFFVFVNSDNNQTCVLYRRSDGNYGLIEPTMAEAEAS